MRQVIFGGMITSIMLELLQMITALWAGFTFRIVDINDVIFNTFGVAIGYMLFIWFMYIVRFILDKWHIEQNPILKYVYERSQFRITQK
jgi:glycopeptide antibiotics resistance protein